MKTMCTAPRGLATGDILPRSFLVSFQPTSSVHTRSFTLQHSPWMGATFFGGHRGECSPVSYDDPHRLSIPSRRLRGSGKRKGFLIMATFDEIDPGDKVGGSLSAPAKITSGFQNRSAARSWPCPKSKIRNSKSERKP